MLKRKIDVYFHKNGNICINANVAKALDIKHGDAIDVHYDKDTKELYLYVSRKKEDMVATGSYKAIAKSTKPNCRNLRVQSKEITIFVNRITGAEESWLYVGALRQTKVGTALPLIYLNNQFRKQENERS